MTRRTVLLFCILLAGAAAQGAHGQSAPPLTVLALGNAGERGAILRGNAALVAAMISGDHNAGVPQMLVFLGDDFGETGLNVPLSEVDGEANATLGFFRESAQALGRSQVHGIPGETEYYSQKAVETTALFGLISLSRWPIGVSDRGTERARERPEWTYHAHFPDAVILPTHAGPHDSVEFVFVDSGILLRTRPDTWTPMLDSLRRLLAIAKSRTGVRWHVLCTHHPFVSFGDHAGYSYWDQEDSTVAYMTGCDKDTNAFRYVHNWVDPEDVCTDRYQAYIDSLESVISRAGVDFQLQLSAHDESLQLIDRNPQHENPHIQIVSGCGSAAGHAKICNYTAARKDNQGVSDAGLVQLRWGDAGIQVTFYNERNGDKVVMGNAATGFSVSDSGELTPLENSH